MPLARRKITEMGGGVRVRSDVPARIQEDARVYRGRIAPYKGRITPEQEARARHLFLTNRGLKVERGDEIDYDEHTHTLTHPTPDDHAAVGRDYFSLLRGAVKLARKLPKPHPDELAFLQPIWKQWQAWRKHVADNERRGRRDLYEGAPPIMDHNARLVFADWLADRGDPREAIVRRHVDREMYQMTDDIPRLAKHRVFGRHPESMHKHSLYYYNAIGEDAPPDSPVGEWDFSRDLLHPGQTRESTGERDGNSIWSKARALPSVVWRHKGTTTSRRSAGPGRFVEHPVAFHAPVTFDEFFKIADTMPEKKRKEWEAFADLHHWKRPTTEPHKLARKHTDLQKHADFWNMVNAAIRKPGQPEHNPVAHGVLADMIGEMVGNPDDPRAHVVRHAHPMEWDRFHFGPIGEAQKRLHVEHPNGEVTSISPASITRWTEDPDTGGIHTLDAPEAYRINAHTGMVLMSGSGHHWSEKLDARPGSIAEGRMPIGRRENIPVVQWKVHVPRTKSGEVRGTTFVVHHAFVKPDGTADRGALHKFIHQLPRRNAAHWSRVAARQGWESANQMAHESEADYAARVNDLFGLAPKGKAKLARAYHVQPGEAILGGEDFIHEIHDEAGNRIGHVWVQPKDGGETLHINHIGAAGHVPNASGLGKVRDVMRQLRTHYPNAKRLTGLRVSGRRQGNDVSAKLAATKVTKPIGRDASGAWRYAPMKPAAPTYRVADDPTAQPRQQPAVRTDPLTGRMSGRGWEEVGGDTLPLKPQPETLKMHEHLGIKKVAKNVAQWALKHAGAGDNAARFAKQHGYENAKIAKSHLALLMIAAARRHKATGENVFEIDHPHTGRKITIRVSRPAAKPTKLARTRLDSTGSAMASAGSENHKSRIEIVRAVLKEAGLTPALVRSAISHADGQSKPSFATVIKRAVHPDHLRYAGAWLGLLTGQQRIAVVHPDKDGEDFLHVISSPDSPDHVTERLRAAGVERFTTEHTSAGSRVYVLNPLGKHPVEKIAEGIPNAKHSTGRVRVYRLGSGSSSSADARSGYRHVIDDFERAAGRGSDDAQT